MKAFSAVLICVTLLFLTASLGYGEKRIKKAKVPEHIRSYIDREYKGAKGIRYYIEVKKDTTYYEVELKYKKEKLSLLFQQDGKLYELEKEVKFKALPAQTQKNILTYLDATYSHYKISEVQFVNPHLQTEYELSIKAKDQSGSNFYDMHFSEFGKLLYTDEIIIKPIPSLF